MQTQNIFFSLISPIHNEEKTIAELVHRSITAISSYRPMRGKKWEYILVDDASTDRSAEMILKAKAEHPDIIVGVRHKKQLGQGHALQTGFFLGRGEIFSTLDADLEKMPEDIPRLLQVFFEKRCDIVCSYIKEKNLPSRIGNDLLRTLFDYDVQQISTNQMVLASQYIRKAHLVKNDQRYVVPIALSLGARKIEEVETAYTPRRFGSSKYKIWKKMLQGLPEILSLKRRIQKGFYHRRLNEDYRLCFERL